MHVTPRRVAAFKLSLLASLGVVPLACGGNSTGAIEGDMHQAGTGGSSSAIPTICTAPEADPLTGLVNCAEGYGHRPKALDCQFTPTKAYPGMGGTSATGDALPRADGTVPCANDPSVCNGFAYGYCLGSVCGSGCVNDFDCATGEICACGYSGSPTGGVCHASACKVDTDCDPGMLCATFRLAGNGLPNSQGYPAMLACQTASDQCAGSADCKEGQECEWFAVDGYRSCVDICTTCGRPFLVEATPRLAQAAARADWSLRQAPSVAHLSVTERATQAAHWTYLGQMEHASIAAFARFSLQLLSLGAPAELVEACTRALADETAHTQLCFGIASAYAGSAIGPGPLDITGSLQVTSLEDIVELVIAEGCFGETSAALEALEAADSAADPVIRAAYAQIAVDEQRHAELAFRFVRWALGQSDATVRARIQAVIATPSSHDRTALSVALPCLQALLQATPPAPAAARAPANLPAI